MNIWMRIVPLFLFVMLAIFFFHGLSLDPKLIPSSLVGQPMPRFALPTLADPAHLFSSEHLKGKPCLVHVWASWCEACQTQHPQLLKLARSKKIAIYGLLYKDTAKTAQQFLQQLGNPYQQVFLDERGRVALDFGVYSTPETFLIDAQGIIRFRLVGPLTGANWHNIISFFQQPNTMQTI